MEPNAEAKASNINNMSYSLPILNEQLKNKVVTATCPKFIFCVGSLWVIALPENSMYSLEEATKILNPLFHAHRNSKFIVFTSGQLTSDIKKGNLFACASCLPENLIYNPDGLTIPAPELSKRMEIISNATAQFHFGLGRSGAFMEGGAFYFAKQELSIAMFMLHQAAELLLRGLLISLTNHNLRSHSLNEFNNKIRKCIPKLVFLEDDGSDEKYLLEQLEYSYSSARYNIAYEIQEELVWVLEIQKFQNCMIFDCVCWFFNYLAFLSQLFDCFFVFAKSDAFIQGGIILSY